MSKQPLWWRMQGDKETRAALQRYSLTCSAPPPNGQVLIFVSSRRQTRLTALDLLAYAAADDRPRAFLHMTGAWLQPSWYGAKVKRVYGAAAMGPDGGPPAWSQRSLFLGV